jgi:hypothetical protein
MAMTGAVFCPRATLAAGWHYYDPECPISLGDKTMKFVAMQPKKNIDRVCDALPDTGPTVIALDAFDPELREMNWDIQILRKAPGKTGDAEADGETLFRLPVQKYRNGMVNFDYNFSGAGDYVLLARMTSDNGSKEYVGRHHFTVGLLDNTEFFAFVFFGCFLLAGSSGIALTMRSRRRGIRFRA